MSLRYSFAWWSAFHEGDDPIALLHATAAAGYEGVEMIDHSLWDEVRDAGLEVALMHGHLDWSVGLNRRENHAAVEEEVLASIEAGAPGGGKAFAVFSGLTAGLSDEAGLEAASEGVGRVPPAGRRGRGVGP